MKSIPAKLVFSLLAAVTATTSALAAEFLIHDGDRVVFLGDSITEQRLYTTYIEAYTLTRYPNWKLTFRNVGWGGDTAWLRQRAHPDENLLFGADESHQKTIVDDSVSRGLARDVLPLHPTFVTVDFGMNDHAYQPFRGDIYRAFLLSQQKIATSLKEAGARVALVTPQPIEEKRPDPAMDARNQALRQFSDGLKGAAARTGATYVDQFDPYMTMLTRERPMYTNGFVGGGDAVHPGPAGHTVMAWAILKGLGASDLVSRVDIDGAAGKLTAAQNCKVDNLKVEGKNISFDRLDEALPMPIDPKAHAALKLAPILQQLDRYELRVAGLPAGEYSLTVDGKEVGKASAEDLMKGWNLASLGGPIPEQSRHVLGLVVRKNDAYYNRWRNVQLYSFPDWAKGPENETKRTAELAKEDQKIAEMEAEIDAARKPKTHHFELKPSA